MTLAAFRRHEVAVLFWKSGEFLGQIQMKGWRRGGGPLMLLLSRQKGRTQVAYIMEKQKSFFSLET